MKIKLKFEKIVESFIEQYHFDTPGGNVRGVEMDISFIFTPSGVKMAEPTVIEDCGVKNYHVVKEGKPLPKADVNIYIRHGFIYDRGRDIEKPDREEIFTVGENVEVEIKSIEALRPNAAAVHIKGEGLYYPRGYIYMKDYILVRENEITLLEESEEVREHLSSDVLYVIRAEYIQDKGEEHRLITVYPVPQSLLRLYHEAEAFLKKDVHIGALRRAYRRAKEVIE